VFTKEFCDDLPADPFEAADKLLAEFFTTHSRLDDKTKRENIRAYIDAMIALQSYLKSGGLSRIELPANPKLTGDRLEFVNSVVQWFQAAATKIQAARAEEFESDARARYDGFFQNDHIVELSDDEHRRIQDLIDQLRQFLSESTVFDQKHKERLLARLEKLQQELHKTMANIDRFWGFLSDAGIALGKFGSDAKPLFDRAREIVEVLYGAQHRTAQLPGPADVPQLPDYSGTDPD